MGHVHRAASILRHVEAETTVLTSRIADRCREQGAFDHVVDLECDMDDIPPAGVARADDVDCFHYAPMWSGGCRTRIAQFTDWVQTHRPELLVVDVSVEITLLARLAGLPTVVVRQHGDRTDMAHAMAYQSAEALLAPFPELLEDDLTPPWVRAKTIYVPGFCRFETDQNAVEPVRRRIVAMAGRGGSGVNIAGLVQAAGATPDWDWHVAGPVDETPPDSLPPNLKLLGWVDDTRSLLASAQIVVSAAGHNSVMEIATTGRPLIAIAEPRPFDEQVRKAAVLADRGLAVGLDRWPDSHRWPELMAAAARIDTDRWQSITRSDGARRAAQAIVDVADRCRAARLGTTGGAIAS